MKTGVSRTMVLPTNDAREDGKRATCASYTIAPSALEHLWNVNTYMRAYAVVVDCLTERAKPFYEQYGFMSLGQFRGHERMFLPMKTVGRLFEI